MSEEIINIDDAKWMGLLMDFGGHARSIRDCEPAKRREAIICSSAGLKEASRSQEPSLASQHGGFDSRVRSNEWEEL
jgi:hypothetical protein